MTKTETRACGCGHRILDEFRGNGRSGYDVWYYDSDAPYGLQHVTRCPECEEDIILDDLYIV